MTKLMFGKDVEKIAKLISKRKPAIKFVAWDLTPFIPHMHNWRRNIVFVECDTVAVEPLTELLGSEYSNYDIYSGVKKPVIRINRGGREASIVIVARAAKARREVEGTSPKLEKCLVDLLYYSKNDVLPLFLNDVLGVWEHYLTAADEIRFSDLYRYSLRRYLGWFVSIFAYEVSKKTKLRVDGRHLRQGMKNLELLEVVKRLE